jgi:hypothetical protein
MSTQTTVWVLIATDGVADKVRDLVDSGYFSEAKDLDYHLKNVCEKISALVNEKGGSIALSTYDRQVLQLPITVAEELPVILAGFKEVFGALMSVGMGLDLREASIAAKKSTFTNDIELYDPKDESYKEFRKSLQIEDDVFGPQPNQYDMTHPKSPSPDSSKTNVGKYVPGLDAQQQLQAEGALINATIQQLMGPANQIQQQAQQQQQQQAEQEKQPPESMLEAVSGEKKKDKPDTETKQKKDSDSKGGKDDDSDSDSSDSSDSDEDDDSSDDSDATTEKIGKLLANVQEKLPELMALHDKNPDAFKKVIGLVHKLVDVAKQKKSVKKTELVGLTEELNKAIKIRYPVGTTKGRKKKIMVDGKAVWRSVAAGQVKDVKGDAISVASHNAKAKAGTEGVRE